MIDTPQVTQSTAQTAVVLHLTIPRSEIRTVMGPGYGEVMDAVKAQGMTNPDPSTWRTELDLPLR